MLEFVNHETFQYPPVLAKDGEMRSGTKSNLVNCILPDSTTSTIDAKLKPTGDVLDDSVLINLMKPKKNQPFKDFLSEVFYPQICKHQYLYVADTVDKVFDTNKKQSLKMTAQVKRGEVAPWKVQGNSVEPTS